MSQCQQTRKPNHLHIFLQPVFNKSGEYHDKLALLASSFLITYYGVYHFVRIRLIFCTGIQFPISLSCQVLLKIQLVPTSGVMRGQDTVRERHADRKVTDLALELLIKLVK